MINESYRALLPQVARHIDAPSIDEDWQGIDAVMPLLERMRQEGAVVIIKLDGERGPQDNGPYTFVVSSPHQAKSGPLRTDSHSLESGLAYVVVNYARQRWGFAG